MKINLNDIKALCCKVINSIEKFDTRIVDGDYYWVFLDDIYNSNTLNYKPSEVGSFVDDWDSLKKALATEDPLSSVDIERLGNIIKIIGVEICKKKESEADYKHKLIKLNLSDLKTFYDTILIKIQRIEFNEFEVEIDHYWDVDFYDGIDFLADTYELCGEKLKVIKRSFVNDWYNLKKILIDEKPITPDDFFRLGNTIKIIGEMIET